MDCRARIGERGKCRIEVVDTQKEPHPVAVLSSHEARLVFAIASCEQNSGLAAKRSHHDPSLWPTVVGRRTRIFHQFESEDIAVKRNRVVIVIDQQGYQGYETHLASDASSAPATVLVNWDVSERLIESPATTGTP